MMLLRRARGLFALALGLLWLWPAAAGAQTPYNRKIESVAVLPDPAGGAFHDIHVVWTASAEPASVPRDVGTRVALELNGTRVAIVTEPMVIDAGGTVCEAGPPCSGSCGTGSHRGGAVSLLCYKDGSCTPGFCDCDCGYWIVSEFDHQELAPGDEITVILYPAPGALPEGETGDDQTVTTFHDQPIGWNRAIEGVELHETRPGEYDVRVTGSVGWEAQAALMNLDLRIELQVNGATRSSLGVPAEVDGIFDQTCWQQGCGTPCGVVNGVQRNCDPYIWWDCACFAGWLSVFPGVGLSPGDEITVILYPAPGALPELPGTGGDDEASVSCCPTVAVDEVQGAAARPWRLGQNRPNPARPLTSIAFDLASGGAARVDVIDAAGRHVHTLLDRTLTAGTWSVTWDGRTAAGRPAASGTYFYRLALDGRSETRRMVLLSER